MFIGYNLQETCTATNYANVAYRSLLYNMASATLAIKSNSKSVTSCIQTDCTVNTVVCFAVFESSAG